MGGIADNSRRHALGATRFDCNESTTQASTNSVLFGSTPPNAYSFEPASWCRSKSFDLLVALLRIADYLLDESSCRRWSGPRKKSASGSNGGTGTGI
jgi:hypothetical protein